MSKTSSNIQSFKAILVLTTILMCLDICPVDIYRTQMKHRLYACICNKGIHHRTVTILIFSCNLHLVPVVSSDMSHMTDRTTLTISCLIAIHIMHCIMYCCSIGVSLAYTKCRPGKCQFYELSVLVSHLHRGQALHIQ